MADRITPEQRSHNMKMVKGKNTKPEMYLRQLLFSRGFRYRIHSDKIPGHPDMWLKKYNTAVFVHGCFWHRHYGCKYASTPQTRETFWKEKFQRNQERDVAVKKQLKSQGIKCLIVWECTLKTMQKDSVVKNDVEARIEEFLNSDKKYLEI